MTSQSFQHLKFCLPLRAAYCAKRNELTLSRRVCCGRSDLGERLVYCVVTEILRRPRGVLELIPSLSVRSEDLRLRRASV
jgi:hypothetical protein